MSEITDCQLEQAGYQKLSAPLPACAYDVLDEVLDSVVQENFRRRRNGTRYAIRNAHLAVPALRPLLEHGALVELARGVLGQTVALVSATLFDKRPAANWFVPPHQDLFVPISGTTDDLRWTNWSIKAGVQYVEPPVEVQRELLAVRLHLDACPGVNGALEVVPGSQHERLDEDAVAEFAEKAFEVCPAGPGEVLLMRPLLVHRSRAAKLPARRRVLHVVYSAAVLPKGLEWT